MGERIVYCEMDYWNLFARILSESKSPLDEGFEKIECASKMCRAILKASKLKFDNKEKFDKARKEQTYLRRLVDRSENVLGSLEINCESYFELPNIPEDCLNSLFLSEVHVLDAAHKGVLAINNDRTTSDAYMYRDFGKSIERKQQLSWGEILKPAMHNCNAMLMFDNYLLKKKDGNLYKILEALLPEKLDDSVSFDLSLFTLDHSNLTTEYDTIKERILSIRPNLNVNLSLFQCVHGDFHDRAIITNYLWIGCGAGFDLLNNDKRGFHQESEKTTTIPMVFPNLQDSTNWAPSAYENFINDARRIKKNNICFGSGINRLLE